MRELTGGLWEVPGVRALLRDWQLVVLGPRSRHPGVLDPDPGSQGSWDSDPNIREVL